MHKETHIYSVDLELEAQKHAKQTTSDKQQKGPRCSRVHTIWSTWSVPCCIAIVSLQG